jgi:hypothetical protein
MYVTYSIVITGIIIIASIVTFLIYPSHFKKIALILGITGLFQVIWAGFLNYPYIIFMVLPIQSTVGIIAITIGAAITIYGRIKRKTVASVKIINN